MFKKFIKTYYKLLDEKLENGTMVVLIIAILVTSSSFITNNANAFSNIKSNILESRNDIKLKENIIKIDGVKYKIILEKI